jgi:hypothetical protein
MIDADTARRCAVRWNVAMRRMDNYNYAILCHARHPLRGDENHIAYCRRVAEEALNEHFELVDKLVEQSNKTG